jgi:hypothetical protein
MAKLDIQPLDIQPMGGLDIQPLDIQPLEEDVKRNSKWTEDLKKSFGDALNTLDTGISLPASVLARTFSGQDEQEKIFAELQKRTDARKKEYGLPEGVDQTFGGKAVGMVGTLPLQLLALPFASAETGKTFIDEGESVGKAQAAIGVDAALNALGMALPGAVPGKLLKRATSGAAINAAQDTASRVALQQLADKEGTKTIFEPSLETAGLAAIPGAAIGALPKRGAKPIGDMSPDGRMKAAAEARKAAKAQTQQLDVDRGTQLDLFDTDTQGRGQNVNIPLDATMRVDENGMPIRQDLSEELARTERAPEAVRQPDMFGNEPLQPLATQRVLPIGEDAQMGLPFMSTIEDVAAQKAARDQSGQMDMFVEAEKRPDGFQEKLRQAAIDEPNMRLAEEKQQIARQQQMEQMFRERENAQRAQQDLDTQLAKEEALLPLQEQLSQERVSKGQQRKATRGRVRREQGGFLDLSFLDFSKKTKIVEDLLATELRAEAPKGVDVVDAALGEGRDGRGLSYTESGGTLTAMKRRSAAVLGASRIVQDAVNKADLAIRQTVLPVETSLRKLQRNELTQLMNVFKEETALEKKFTAQELADFGYSPKVLAAYNDMRNMFSKALQKENAAREAKGQKPITELEYYSSHRWQGNFRQDFMSPKLDEQGNVKLDSKGQPIMQHVWSLAGKSKADLARQRAALLKQFPDLKADKERILRQGRDIAAPSELYKHMLDILGENDPAVQRIKQWYEKTGVEDPAAAMLAQEKHFKNRAGVRGYIGDRPVNEVESMFNRKEGKFNPEREAMDFFQEQITYAKNGFKWAEMQAAGQQIKDIVSNPELVAQQPNNVKYIKDYWKQNLGVSEAKWIGAMEDNLHDIGISPGEVRKVVNDVKSAWIGQKLLGSAGFIASNVVQSTAVLPHMMDIMVKTGGNPLTGLASGMMGLMTLAPTHLFEVFTPNKEYSGPVKKAAMTVMPEWHAAALKYAEDNGVISRSTYDESPIEASFSLPRRAAELVGKATITSPETFLRAFSFMAFAEQLRSSGKYDTDVEVFRLAEERTNAAMADYRAGERPILFNKGGIAGDLAGALQTFPVNFYNQWNWALRESMRGNALPALTMAMVQYSVAGFMGLPGFQDMDKFMEMVKEWAAKNSPKMWDTIKDMSPKRMVMDHLGEEALYGKLSTESGYAMTSRVAAPSGSDMLMSGTNVIADVGKQLGNVASLAINPSEQQMAKTLLESAPVGMQGALETGPLRDIVSKDVEGGRLYNQRGSTKGAFTRTPEDEAIRAYGVRSQREALLKDETWQRDSRIMQGKEAAKSTFEQFYKAVSQQNQEEAASYMRLYVELTGKAPTDKQIENRVLQDLTDKIERGELSAKENINALTAIKRMKDIVNNRPNP